jgi:hypothetical protein
LPYTRASGEISVELIQYDTKWPQCDHFWLVKSPCDPKFEVCLSG